MITKMHDSLFDEGTGMMSLGNSSTLKPSRELLSAYTTLSVIVAIITIIGNSIIIVVFCKNKKLRRKTNYYIASLAVADLFVGVLAVPIAVTASMRLLDRNLTICLFTLSTVFSLCAVSILNLVAISVDRYWAILYPIGYSQNVNKKLILVMISLCWLAGSFIGFLPLLGWNAGSDDNTSCLIASILPFDYLMSTSIGMMIIPCFVMCIFYAHIYYIISRRLKRIVTIKHAQSNGIFSIEDSNQSGRNQNRVALRITGAEQRQDINAAKTLSIIVFFFIVCWFPMCIVNILSAFCPECYNERPVSYISIVLTHMNSALNPILYAYHLKGFKVAFQNLIAWKKNSVSPNPQTDLVA